MSLASGTRIGAYEIRAKLGAGGMGEVYRARDTRLDRDVAIKILPEAFAADPDRLMRFQREAKTLAALNHPSIAHIHGIEEGPSTGSGQGLRALVMEIVEGEDLAQRIARGPIPLDEALPLARQIAEALEAAHDAGVIHRDLKPANIKVRPDGTVKVLDFGLAKALDPAGAADPRSDAHSPTFTSPALTQMGVILGTAAYMAPEQAKGRAVDRRADVWAFGAVLYEMLTSRRAFEGEDVSDTLASVLKSDPAWDGLPPDTPAAIRRLLRRCLARDPKLRLRDCGSALLEIHDAERGDDAVPPPPAARADAPPGWTRAAVLALALATLGLAGVSSWVLFLRGVPPPAVHRTVIPLPPTDILPRNSGGLLALSPDGRTLLYRAQRDRTFPMFRRPLDQFTATVIPGTEGNRDVFVSPDGAWVGLIDDLVLKKMPAGGGQAQTLAKLPGGVRGIEWGPDGRILVGVNAGGRPLLEVPEAGGEPRPLFTPDGEARVWYPHLLADGRTVLFTLVTDLASPGELHLLDVGTGTARLLLPNAMAGRVVATGHLVFVRESALWAVPFDGPGLQIRGTPAPVVEDVRVEGGGAAQYAVSAGGTLVYIAGTPGAGASRPLVWLTPDGREEPLAAPPREYISVRLSPDGTRAAVGTGVATGPGADVWVTEIARGTLTRITSSGRAYDPVWSPDGRSVVFTSVEDGRQHLLRRSADGSGEAATIATFDRPILFASVRDWLRDGSLIVEVVTDNDGGAVGMLSADGSAPWRPIVQTPASERQSAASPDGRWLAYASDETGQSQVYVRPLAGAGTRLQVPGPGHSPAWSRDGTGLVYLRGGPPTDVMRVAVRPGPDAGTLALGDPEVVAGYRFYSRRSSTRYFDTAADGRLLFIGSGLVDAERDREIRVITNWFEDLRRIVPLK